MNKKLRTLLSAIICLIALIAPAQNVAAQSSPNYADVLMSSSGVINPGNAVDADLTNYAVMRTPIGITNSATLQLGWSQYGTSGQSAGLEFQNDNGGLSADVLQSISLTLYDSNGQQIAKQNGFGVSDATVVQGTDHYIIRLKPKGAVLDIAAIKIKISGLASIENRIRIYDAVLTSACGAIQGGSIYAKHNVQNANRAITASKSDYATLTPPLAFGNSYLDIAFSEPATAGKPVTFQLGEGNTTLSADLLQNITLTVYDVAGNVVASKSGFELADAQILSGGKFNLSIQTPDGSYEVARGRITFTSMVNVLSTLKVYSIVGHAGGCGSPSPTTAGSEQSAITGVRVYPNPFQSYTVIDLRNVSASNYHITITDKTGNIKEERELTGKGEIKVLDKAATGVYFINIVSGKSSTTIKVIKL